MIKTWPRVQFSAAYIHIGMKTKRNLSTFHVSSWRMASEKQSRVPSLFPQQTRTATWGFFSFLGAPRFGLCLQPCLFIADMPQLASNIRLMTQDMTDLSLFSDYRRHTGNAEAVSALSWSVYISTGELGTDRVEISNYRPPIDRPARIIAGLSTIGGSTLIPVRLTRVPLTPETYYSSARIIGAVIIGHPGAFRHALYLTNSFRRSSRT